MTEKPTELKHRVGRPSVVALAKHIAAFDPGFQEQVFTRQAMRGLAKLELKARIGHVAAALARNLPESFSEAAAILDGANTLQLEAREALGHVDEGAFVFWPLCTYVEMYGLGRPDAALDTMHSLTQLASCEFAIRPYIEQHTQLVFARLERWVRDKNPHVRRLVSEGTRPLLPWGRRLHALRADPRPSLALLDQLFDDDELYVRRSVANHLNDVSKDHPALALTTAKGWLRGKGTPQVEWVVRHALRSLVKQGNRGALELQGIRPPRLELGEFQISPKRLRFGGAIELSVTVKSKVKQRLVVDFAVHHMKANGTLRPKVFKWTRREVDAGERLELSKSHGIRAITTRRYYAGEHLVELLINGRSFGTRSFELVDVPLGGP